MRVKFHGVSDRSGKGLAGDVIALRIVRAPSARAIVPAVALLGAFGSWSRVFAEDERSRSDGVVAIERGVAAALEGDLKGATRDFERARALAPEVREVSDAFGAALLLLGDQARASTTLAGRPSMAAYLAMAQSIGPGGKARAQSILAEHARLPDDRAAPGAVFLAALAFHAAGQPARAHELLSRALTLARDALDEAFAPDPAVGMSRAAVSALRSLRGTHHAILSVAKKLIEHGRRGEAKRLLEELTREGIAGDAARRALADLWSEIDPEIALEEIDRIRAEGGGLGAWGRDGVRGPRLEEVDLLYVELLIARGRFDLAQEEVERLRDIDPDRRPAVDRARARLSLEAGSPADALRHAESAVSLEPASNAGLALLSRALLESGHIDRAFAFAQELLARKPKTIDPYPVLIAVSRARREPRKTRALELRSEAFRMERARIDLEARRREKMLRAVRGLERGLGVSGLEALRGEAPMLALPVDLAIARRGSPGARQGARDRILAACAPELLAFLRSTTGWDRVRVDASLYGTVETIDVALSSADPGRCSHPQGVRETRPRRR